MPLKVHIYGRRVSRRDMGSNCGVGAKYAMARRDGERLVYRKTNEELAEGTPVCLTCIRYSWWKNDMTPAAMRIKGHPHLDRHGIYHRQAA